MSEQPQVIRREDYKEPDFIVEKVELVFDLDRDVTNVKSRLFVAANPARDRSPQVNGHGVADQPTDRLHLDLPTFRNERVVGWEGLNQRALAKRYRAILFGVAGADRFLSAYLGEPGAVEYEPHWDCRTAVEALGNFPFDYSMTTRHLPRLAR